jgi:glucokinase
MILAADVGGTSTRIGVFDAERPRPRVRVSGTLATPRFADFISLIRSFLESESIDRAVLDRAAFGVAGPVIDNEAQLTNVPWRIQADVVAEALGLEHVRLLNDLEAMACAVPVLEEAEVYTLQRGEPHPKGNISIVAAGTGLGIAMLHNVAGRLISSPSEGGHADFAARTEREIALVRSLTDRFGRAEVEQVVSGPGLVNFHRLTHAGSCRAGVQPGIREAPADISRAALAGDCPNCVEALELFVEAYGAVAGNLVLGAVATGGIYLGGGIAPKILPALTTGTFLKAFSSKAPLDGLLARVPVKVILNDGAGLVGAAVAALKDI